MRVCGCGCMSEKNTVQMVIDLYKIGTEKLVSG